MTDQPAWMPRTHPELGDWPAHADAPFRRFQSTTLIGHGSATWERASHDVLRWVVKTRSGFTVDDAGPVSPGARLTITARVAGLVIREPIEVLDVVVRPARVGFSYRTLPGHPVTGEEAFIVHREGDAVHLTLRSVTAPAPQQPWRALHPLLRVAQAVVRGRYIRALL